MDVNLLFKICSTLVLPFWLALTFAPEHKLVKNLVTAIAIILALVYASMLPTFLQMEEGGFGSLAEVMILFKNPAAVLAGWIHYLVFDLLTARWIALDAVKNGISKWFVAPCLLFTLMLGPVGFLLYTILKYFYPKNK
jgi:hypothetical protein